MRLALVLALVAGCIPPPTPEPDPYEPPYYDDGWTGPGGDPFYGCRQDSECGTQTCARDGQCYPASSIRSVTTTWTIDGELASTASCTTHPSLYIRFHTLSEVSFGFAPVPCKNGKFFVDKIATTFARVEMGIDGAGSGNVGTISSDGEALIDLP